MEVLTKEGLQLLINNIQNQTLKTKEYTNITALGNNSTNGSIFFLKLEPLKNSIPWVLKYKISSSVTIGTDESKIQFGEITLGGIDKKISLYSSSNIIGDLSKLSANNQSILINSQGTYYIGLDICGSFSENHKIKVEIQNFKNCNLTFFNNIKYVTNLVSANELSTCTLNQINFSKSGTTSSEFTLFFDQLADVAKTGSYNDLKDKPQLLDLILDEDELSFYYHL